MIMNQKKRIQKTIRGKNQHNFMTNSMQELKQRNDESKMTGWFQAWRTGEMAPPRVKTREETVLGKA